MTPILALLSVALLASPPSPPELGTLKGTATATQTTCGGPAVPPPGCRQVTAPYTHRMALLRQTSPEGTSPYKYMLSTWVVPDSTGSFQIDDSPGTYFLMSTDELMQVGLDGLAAGLLEPLATRNLLPQFVEGPFDVVADQTTTADFDLVSPPPPISIGVGN